MLKNQEELSVNREHKPVRYIFALNKRIGFLDNGIALPFVLNNRIAPQEKENYIKYFNEENFDVVIGAGIEYSLLPWMREHEVALMSYCPLAQAGTLKRGLMTHPVLVGLAEKYNATVEQIMLAWNIRDGYTIAIPRSGKAEHTLQNAGADLITLSEEDYQAIDRAFPKPVRKEYLDMQ